MWGIFLSKRLWIAPLACVVFAGGMALQPRDVIGGDAPSAKSILDKAIEVHGGAQRIGREVALIRTEEGEMIVDGEKVPLKGEWQFQPSGKRAFQLAVKIGDLNLNVTAGIDGDKGWTKFGPSQAVDLTPEQVTAHIWEHNNHMQAMAVLVGKRGDYDASMPKAVKFGDRDAWLIDFTGKKNKRVVSLAFDKATGEFIGDESVESFGRLGDKKSREKLAKFRVVFNNYIDVDGVKMPGALSISRDGVPLIEVRKVQMRVVDTIDPKVFEKPK